MKKSKIPKISWYFRLKVSSTLSIILSWYDIYHWYVRVNPAHTQLVYWCMAALMLNSPCSTPTVAFSISGNFLTVSHMPLRYAVRFKCSSPAEDKLFFLKKSLCYGFTTTRTSGVAETPCDFVYVYITLHYIKSYLECPKSLRTARTLYEIKGVMWEYSYVGKHLEKR